MSRRASTGRFEPETDSIELRTGATTTVFFHPQPQPTTRRLRHAVYNVTPEVSGAWFDKISCFCFTEQHLGPHESAELPVVFFLDPRLEKERDMDGVQRDHAVLHVVRARPESAKPVALAPDRRVEL